MKIKLFVAALFVFAPYPAVLIAAEKPGSAGSSSFTHSQPAEEKLDLSSLKIDSPKCYRLGKEYIVIGTDPELDKKAPGDGTGDYGLRLFVIEKKDGSYSVIYRSKGSKDSANLSPDFFKDGTDSPILVLAENGAEYSYGIRVFTLSGRNVSDLGSLDVGVDSGENIVSAVPFTLIRKVGNDIVFSFSRNVELHPGGKNQRTVPKGKIKYRYSHGILQEAIE